MEYGIKEKEYAVLEDMKIIDRYKLFIQREIDKHYSKLTQSENANEILRLSGTLSGLEIAKKSFEKMLNYYNNKTKKE